MVYPLLAGFFINGIMIDFNIFYPFDNMNGHQQIIDDEKHAAE